MRRCTNWVLPVAVLLLGLACEKKKEPVRFRTPGDPPRESQVRDPAERIPITATKEGFCTVLFGLSTRDTAKQGLYAIGSDGTGLRHLCKARVRSAARVSPNGKRLTWESNSKNYGGDCQAIYDIERDSVWFLRKPEVSGLNVGWYPRWWDDEHIYYRNYRNVIKQNIRTGEHESITKHVLKTWLDPIWVPEIRKFVNVEKRRICTFNMDGSEYRCDSLEYTHKAVYPPTLIRRNGDLLVGYETHLRGQLRPPNSPVPTEMYVMTDFRGGTVFSGSAYPMLQEGGGCVVASDPSGAWIYFVERKDPLARCVNILHRHPVSDTLSVETVLATSDGSIFAPSTMNGRQP